MMFMHCLSHTVLFRTLKCFFPLEHKQASYTESSLWLQVSEIIDFSETKVVMWMKNRRKSTFFSAYLDIHGMRQHQIITLTPEAWTVGTKSMMGNPFIHLSLWNRVSLDSSDHINFIYSTQSNLYASIKMMDVSEMRSSCIT